MTMDHRSEKAETMKELPSAMNRLNEILAQCGKSELVVFLDYDGTLTPIVGHPEEAVLHERMRETVKALAEVCLVAVISGRDLSDVRKRVGLPGVFYAGSHGFDISGPQGEDQEFQQGVEYLPDLNRAEKELEQRLEGIQGVFLERKKFSIAVHYRNVPAKRLQEVSQAVEQVLSRHRELRNSKGKKVYDLQPHIDWNKGKALNWLMQYLPVKPKEAFPVYIGDDVTDEDAFRAVREKGAGILVGAVEGPTKARYRLQDPEEVERFLGTVTARLKGEPP